LLCGALRSAGLAIHASLIDSAQQDGAGQNSKIREVNLKVRHLIVTLLVVIFLITAVFSFAAEEPWFIIKDKNGVCKVIQAKEKTPATIAGPYKTKTNAEKAKDKACAKAGKKK
jgi:hypothetical protein